MPSVAQRRRARRLDPQLPVSRVLDQVHSDPPTRARHLGQTHSGHQAVVISSKIQVLKRK